MDTATRFSTLLFLVLLTAAALGRPAEAQRMVFRPDGDGGGGQMMAVPGGFVMLEGEDQARVARMMQMPGQSDEEVDLDEGDLILFLNGARITSAEQLVELYEAVEVEAEVKLGIQRGEEKMIRTFAKPEQQMQVTPGGGGAFTFSSGGAPDLSPEEAERIQNLRNRGPWGVGFLVGEEDGSVVVAMPIPVPDQDAELGKIAPGDVITRVNGTKIASVAQLNEVYDALEVGAEVEVEYEGAGGTQTVRFKKPQAPRMEIRVNGQ
jgi:S1-C subfamily serine protease